jgi:hypothetical protein
MPTIWPFASVEFVRVFIEKSSVMPVSTHERADMLVQHPASAQLMDSVRLGKDGPDRLLGIERRVGVLKDNLDFFAEVEAFLFVGSENIAAAESHVSAGRFKKPEQHIADCAFSAAAFTYQS